MGKVIEVAICTWNRADLLARTLASILQTRVPADWSRRILVVDNGSTDHTADILRNIVLQHPDTITLHESRPGHTLARNRAVEELSGELVVWTDDDVLVPAHWLERYIERAESHRDETFWGAAIEPEFIDGRPTWIEENWQAVAGCFAARDLGDQILPLTSDRLPYGANFAVRTDVQRQYRFNSQLGRRREFVLGGDELELMQRLLTDGLRGSWVPGNAIKHLIPATRATTDYVWRYFVGQGFRLGSAAGGSRWRLRCRSHWHAWRFRRTRAHAPSPTWFAHLAEWGLNHGRLEALRLRQRAVNQRSQGG